VGTSCLGLGLRMLLGLLVPEPAQVAQPPQSYVLDFVAGRSPAVESSVGKPPVLVAPANFTAEAGRIPFEVTLVSLDRAGYAVGDSVVFELLLKHVGLKPFALPWSRDPESVRGASRVLSASFLLTFADKALRVAADRQREHSVRRGVGPGQSSRAQSR
jgi:hypothetical protein